MKNAALIVTASIAAQNTFTDPLDPNSNGHLWYSVVGRSDSTITLQVRWDGTNWRDLLSIVADCQTLIYNTIPGVWYRLGIKTGNYGTDTVICSLCR